MTEQILVVRTAELKRHYDFQGFLPLDAERVRALYERIEVLPLERDKAEEDPSFKQLVAYNVVRSDGRYLAYLRGKGQGEARLRGNRSIGVGGHINSGDQATLFLDDHLKAAAFRELFEEVRVPKGLDLRFVGLLNDDSNEVGSVHLGLVYLAELPPSTDAAKLKRQRSVAQLSFAEATELRRDREQFETWSRIMIDNLEALQ
jgi:predicted NUDIX family phosphoesterase